MSRQRGLTQVTVKLHSMNGAGAEYEADFLVNTGASDSMAPAPVLERAGFRPVGTMSYELADGTIRESSFGLAVIEFMGEVTAGRIIFGPPEAEPILGVTALESVGILVDPASKTLRRLPAVPLKRSAIEQALALKGRLRLEIDLEESRERHGSRCPGGS